MSKIDDYKPEILWRLKRATVPMSAGWIAEELGCKRYRNGRYSPMALRRYNDIGRALQALKREGKVVYVGGKGAGWRLA